MSASAAANPASRGFSLAWLSALTNSFTSLLCRVVGLCAGYRIKKNPLCIVVLEEVISMGGFSGFMWTQANLCRKYKLVLFQKYSDS